MEKTFLTQKQATLERESWKEAMYFQMVQKVAMKDSHHRLYKKLKATLMH